MSATEAFFNQLGKTWVAPEENRALYMLTLQKGGKCLTLRELDCVYAADVMHPLNPLVTTEETLIVSCGNGTPGKTTVFTHPSQQLLATDGSL